MSSAPSSADPTPDRLGRASAEAVARILRAVHALSASNPVVVIDGRSGAGKSMLARGLVSAWPVPGRVQLIGLDSLYPGWDGLAEGAEIVHRDILVPHARGTIGVWRRYDWIDDAPAEANAVDPSLPLIIEGSGVLTSASRRVADVTVWVDAPEASRRRRALARDGDTYAPHWDRWAAQEEAHVELHRPDRAAQIVLAFP